MIDTATREDWSRSACSTQQTLILLKLSSRKQYLQPQYLSNLTQVTGQHYTHHIKATKPLLPIQLDSGLDRDAHIDPVPFTQASWHNGSQLWQ